MTESPPRRPPGAGTEDATAAGDAPMVRGDVSRTAAAPAAPPGEPAGAAGAADPLLKIREERESEEIRAFRDKGRTTLNLLYQLVRNFQIYEPENVVFERPLADLDAMIKDLFGSMGEVRLLLVEGQPYIGDLRIRLDSTNTALVQFLADWLAGLGLGGWSFQPPPDLHALRSLFHEMSRFRPETDDPVEEIRSLLARRGVDWAEPHPPQRFRDQDEEVLEDTGSTALRATHVFEHGMAAVRGFFGMLGKTGVGPALAARKAVNSIVDMAIDGGQHALAISMLTDTESPLFTHSLHVANLSVAIGRSLEIPREHLAELGLCGLFHDTGFSDLPPDFGWATDGGDPVVRARHHTILGFRAQMRQRGYHVGRLLRALVNLEHHLEVGNRGEMEWDDARVPLHPFCRIVAVADAYDTLLNDTPTRRAMTPPQALREIWSARGTRFDPLVCQALVNIMGLYPFGSLLELTDGALAVVVERGTDEASFDRPGVRVVRSGESLKQGDLFDLASVPASQVGVAGVHDPREEGIDLLAVLFPDAAAEDDGPPRTDAP